MIRNIRFGKSRVIFHRAVDTDGEFYNEAWWAECPSQPNWTGAADSFEEMVQLAEEQFGPMEGKEDAG